MAYVKDFIEYLNMERYEHLFDEECLRRIQCINEEYGQTESHTVILEVNLAKEACTCDFSIYIDNPLEPFPETWLEFDYARCAAKDKEPCFFKEVSNLYEGDNEAYLYRQQLPDMMGKELAEKLTPMLKKCLAAMKDLDTPPYNVGAMNGRGELSSLRLFTEFMTRKAIIELLRRLSWKGDTEALDQCLARLESYGRKKFIIDFDVYEDHISDKISISVETADKKEKSVIRILDYLEQKGLCLPGKKEDVIRFIRVFPFPKPFMRNDISHFKFSFEGGKVTGAKVYLRQGDLYTLKTYRAWYHPVVMNLELTSRCPLRCPQCYCDMTHAKDLDYEAAVERVREAQACGVRTVNLSGGETLCWKPLDQLVRECSRLGLETNIAISGFGFDRKRAEQLIEAGVTGIFVSLNGSTKSVNEKSRDGYELAINALQILKEIGFPRTRVNWVMRRDNADDFDNMIRLAEDYGVHDLVVIMMKPDSGKSLPGVPSKEQMYAVAEKIRQYRGSLSIVVEECYSQLRAILANSFLFNRNIGLERGCGAGRDGFSVNVDNQLTPCRHLEITEEFDGIMDYWKHSPVLARLRQTEDDIQDPCSMCRFARNCLPCMAIPWNMKGELVMGDETCPVQRPEREN